MSQHPRKRSPQPRMRRGVVRQAVGADHGVLEAENALHVPLVHREVDRPAGSSFSTASGTDSRSFEAISVNYIPENSGCGFDQVTSTFDAGLTRLTERIVDEAQ